MEEWAVETRKETVNVELDGRVGDEQFRVFVLSKGEDCFRGKSGFFT